MAHSTSRNTSNYYKAIEANKDSKVLGKAGSAYMKSGMRNIRSAFRRSKGIARTGVRKAAYGAGFAYGTALAAKGGIQRAWRSPAAQLTRGGAMAVGGGFLKGAGVAQAVLGGTGAASLGMRIGHATFGVGKVYLGSKLMNRGAATWAKGRKGAGAFGGQGAFAGMGRGWRRFLKGRKGR
jgi:hypothetical protein